MEHSDIQIQVAEVKPRKVIGWMTWMDQKKLEKLRSDWKDLFDLKKYQLKERFEILMSLGVIQRQERFDNGSPTVGFTAIAKALTGNIATVAEVKVNIHAFGTDATAFADANTQLGAEGTRSLLSSFTYVLNKAYYTAFYGLTDAVGTWQEMGLFMNGLVGTPNSGTLWDRTIATIVKTNAQSLSIDYEDTFTNTP